MSIRVMKWLSSCGVRPYGESRVIFWVNNVPRELDQKMVIWMERECEIDDFHVTNDPMNVRVLKECRILKYFKVSGTRDHVHLLDDLI